MDKQTKNLVAAIVVISVVVSITFGAFAGMAVLSAKNASAFSFGFPSLEQLKNILFPTPAPKELNQALESSNLPQPSSLPIAQGALDYQAQIVSVVKHSSPAVVSIIISKNLPILQEQDINPFQGLGSPFNFSIPQYQVKGYQEQQVGGGTGFIVTPDGMIVTNKHVVEDTSAQYTVLMNDGSKYPAKVLARDPALDVAIIKIDKTGLPTLTLGDSDKMELGDTAIAIGNALGEFRNTVSVGVISGLARTVQASGANTSETLSNVFQTDAAINLGNSGGPLLNLEGEVIGLNSATAQGAQNIGFSIPINQVKSSILQVEKTGKITVPYLGVRYRLIDAALAKQNNLGADYGAWVVSDGSNPAVIPDGPADKAGIKENDIILEIGGVKIDSDHPLANLIRNYQVGDTVTLTVFRKGKNITLQATLTERPQ